MKALTFEIHALEPLLLTQLEGDPNSSISYRYVPGSVIRGALANRYLPKPGFDLAGDLDGGGRRLFFDGSTRYLNAYPLVRGRCLPAPLSWFCEKTVELQAGEWIYDFSQGASNELEQPKTIGELFCRLSAEKVKFTPSRRQINIHTARERRKGRATKDEGAIFRYQAIAAGERLGGVILVTNLQDVPTLKALLTTGDLWLGGSRSAGYGRARIENVQEAKDDWRETGTPLGDLGPGDRLVITLLSDAILRTTDGACADSLTPALLPPNIQAAVQKKPGGVFKRAAPLGGFNRKWGLPLCQAMALKAGSVFGFEVTGTISAADLKKLEEQGLGERRVEGFGRVAVNWHQERVLTVQDVEPDERDSKPIELHSDSKKLAQQMVERLLRRELDRLLAQYVNSAGCKISSPPSKAQVSRLRAIALNALPSQDTVRLLSFLSDEKLKPRAREQYWGARIGEMRLLDWLRNMLASPQTVWQWLSAASISLPRIGDAQAALSEELAAEYTIRLVDGALSRAAKEQGND